MGRAAVSVGDRLDDRQAEAAAPVAAARTRPAEALEGPFSELLRQARPAIEDMKLDEAVMGARHKRDRSGAVAQRVVEHVAERLAEARPIGFEAQVGLHVDFERAAGVFGSAGEAAGDLTDDLARRRALGTDRQLAAVGLGDRQQVFGDSGRGDLTIAYDGAAQSFGVGAAAPLAAPATTACGSKAASPRSTSSASTAAKTRSSPPARPGHASAASPGASRLGAVGLMGPKPSSRRRWPRRARRRRCRCRCHPLRRGDRRLRGPAGRSAHCRR